MASRAKKKAADTKRLDNAKTNVVETTNLTPNKWTNIYFATTVLLLLFTFFIMLLSPVISGTLKINTTGSSEEAEAHDFHASLLDIGIAPLRGCTAGFRFLLEKMGATFDSNEDYEKIVALAAPYVGQDKIDQANKMGVVTLVFTIIIDVAFLAMLTLYILGNSKFKNKKLSLIGSGLFFIATLAYLIFAMAANVNTIFSSSSITGGWGIWVLLFVAIGFVTIEIVNLFKQKEVKKNENV